MSNDLIFPAEWELHESTWLTWPHNPDTWPNNLSAAQSEFETFVRTIAETETVRLLSNEDLRTDLESRFAGHSRIELVFIPTNDSWIRDYGPTFVKHKASQQVVGVNWIYNCWGEKYPPFDFDVKVAERILIHAGLERIDSKIVLEGGAIETNGAGVCMSTRSCLFNSNRNSNISDDEILKELSDKSGCASIVLVDPKGIEGDDTDGHIDQVARFVSRRQLVVSGSQLESVNLALEAAQCDVRQEVETIEIPEPGVIKLFGSVLPASYANFYFANGIVIVPQFGVANDGRALKVMTDLLPDRDVIGLDSLNLTAGLGSFHCLSQQQPAQALKSL